MRLVEAQLKEGTKELEREQKYMRAWITAAILFAVPWSIGGILDADSRAKFDAFLRPLVSGKDSARPIPESLPPKLDVLYPPDGTVFDWQYEIKGRGQWKHWNEMVRGFEMPTHTDVRRIMVPTVDTARWLTIFALIC